MGIHTAQRSWKWLWDIGEHCKITRAILGEFAKENNKSRRVSGEAFCPKNRLKTFGRSITLVRGGT